jgi:uncharacterized protein YecE (DUF72 family)
MPRVCIGISGWNYPRWRGVFYPKGLPHKRELEYASRQMSSIEINGSFYSLQRPSSYRTWSEQTPSDFVFAVKGGRFITHMKKLRDCPAPLANFFASGVLCLGEKLGPMLWQLPPNLGFHEDRLAEFFNLLPRDTEQAAALARKHDAKIEGRSFTDVLWKGPIRHAVEVRHESFRTPAFIELLRAHRIGLVIADTAGRWPFLEDLTADFVYVRLHGDQELYTSGYSDEALERWAERIRSYCRGETPPGVKDALLAPEMRVDPSKGCDVYVYFDNDAKVHAPFDAIALEKKLKGAAAPAPVVEAAPVVKAGKVAKASKKARGPTVKQPGRAVAASRAQR